MTDEKGNVLSSREKDNSACARKRRHANCSKFESQKPKKPSAERTIDNILTDSTEVVLWFCCVLPGSREQAFVFALSSAAVLQAVAKTCSTGAASKCGCGRSPSTSAVAELGGGGGGVEGFKWGGCADNVDIGAEFSRAFCDARCSADRRRRRRSKRAATNLHNNDAGRRVSTRQVLRPEIIIVIFV